MSRLFTILLSFLVLSAWAVEDNPEALKQALEEKLNANQKDSSTIELLKDLSQHYFSSAPLKGIEYAEMALVMAEENEDKGRKGDIYNYFGNFYRDQGLLDLALEAHLNSLEISEEIGEDKRLAYALNDLGNIYYDRKEYDTALKHYQRAVDISEASYYIPALAVSFNNMGLAYHHKKDYDRAFSYFAKALELREEQGTPELIGHSFNYIGLVYRAQGNYRLATKYFGKALKKFKSANDALRIGDTYFNIGTNYCKQDDHKTALEAYLKAESYYIQMDNKIALTHLYEVIGKNQISDGKDDDAKKYLLEGLGLAQANGFRYLQRKIHGHLSRIYERSGNFKEALVQYKAYSNLKASMTSNEINAKIARIEATYSFREKEKELELAQKENVLAADKLAAQNLKLKFLILSLSVLIAGLLSFFILKLTPKQRQFLKLRLKKKLASAGIL